MSEGGVGVGVLLLKWGVLSWNWGMEVKEGFGKGEFWVFRF